MLSIDPPDEEEEGEENRSTCPQTPNPAQGQTTPGSKSPRLPNPEGTGEESMDTTVEVHEEPSEKRVPPLVIVRYQNQLQILILNNQLLIFTSVVDNVVVSTIMNGTT